MTVDPKNVTHQVNELFNGCHSDSGYTHQPRGLYAQMVLDESFEGFGLLWAGSRVENYTVYNAWMLTQGGEGGRPAPLASRLHSNPTHFPLNLHRI